MENDIDELSDYFFWTDKGILALSFNRLGLNIGY